jgi:hypothetical protein
LGIGHQGWPKQVDILRPVPAVDIESDQRPGRHDTPHQEYADAQSRLPNHHRDPFDRMLIAQSQVEGIALFSNEALFDLYGVARIW